MIFSFGSFFASCFTDWLCGRRFSPPAPSRTGSKVKTGNSPVRKGDRSGGGCAPSLPKAPAKAPEGKPFYQEKMLPTATPVVHGNRPACRMLQNWMTALGGRGEAQSALLAYGGHETGPAVYRRLSARSGYALDRLARNPKAPAAASQCEHAARIFRSANGVAVGE